MDALSKLMLPSQVSAIITQNFCSDGFQEVPAGDEVALLKAVARQVRLQSNQLLTIV
jgi:hypothetical protein